MHPRCVAGGELTPLLFRRSVIGTTTGSTGLGGVGVGGSAGNSSSVSRLDHDPGASPEGDFVLEQLVSPRDSNAACRAARVSALLHVILVIAPVPR